MTQIANFNLAVEGQQAVGVRFIADEFSIHLVLQAYDCRAKIEISGPSRRVTSS
jgi:hypothetical protein